VPRKQYTDLDETLQDVYYQKPVFEPLAKTKYYDFWRLFYTAFSRAQNLLALTAAEKQSSGRGSRNVPSPYFSPVYNSLQSWRTIDLTDLSLESIKEVNIKREYSFTSHIILYENCARQYRFFKDLAFAPVRQNPVLFGMVVHQTIEDIHKAALRGEQNQITTDQISAWFNYNYFNLSQKERVYLAPQQQLVALGHVLRYVGKQNGDWSHIKEAEVEISLVKDQYILKGQVDLIQGDDNTVEIVDFKSEKKPDLHTERERVDRYRRQLEIYAHVVEERLNYEVSKMHLYYTGEASGNPYVSFDNNRKRIDQTIAVIDKTVNRIEEKDYQIAERPDKHCKNCDIRFYCDSL
jgi:DNA helicase-2/ATP-dependent DNA helicase PcrA